MDARPNTCHIQDLLCHMTNIEAILPASTKFHRALQLEKHLLDLYIMAMTRVHDSLQPCSYLSDISLCSLLLMDDTNIETNV